jgi:hypothetical protein
LAAFAPIDEYSYAGMGSVWFSDFILTHRLLGIRDMVSIERPGGSNDRFEDNVPLANIQMIFRSTSQAIPVLDWTKRQIVWLDYDAKISSSILLDISSVTMRAGSGSLLAVSVQCNAASEIDLAEEKGGADPVSFFKDEFGAERVGEIGEEDLYGWRFASTSRRLMLQEVEAALAIRNTGIDPEKRVSYSTVCSFEYADDAKMTTLVLLFYLPSESEKARSTATERLDFVKTNGKTVRIEMPNLTTHEMRWLRKSLPSEDTSSIDVRYVPRVEAERYFRLYRYLPNFAVLEI